MHCYLANMGKKSKKDTQEEDPDSLKIFEYLRSQNRPYSAQNVFDNLHGSIKKANCGKLLDSLVEKGEIIGKEYGKAKIYFYNQEKLQETNEEELRELQGNIEAAAGEGKALREDVVTKQKKLRDISSSLSNEEIETKLGSAQVSITELERKLNELKEAGTVSLAEKESMLSLLKKNQAEELKRKRLCMSILNSLAEMTDETVLKTKDMVGFEDVII